MTAKIRLKEKYLKEVRTEMRRRFGYKNDLAVPRLVKTVVNVGLSSGVKDPKYIETAEQTLTRITGQRPVRTLAKKSISNFKIRQGMVVGMMVTLRGRRMYEFIDKLINVSLPRVRDFRGIPPSSVDGRGNCSLGFREYIAFPEIRSDEIERLHGLEVSLVSTAKNREEGLTLLKLLGFPFREK